MKNANYVYNFLYKKLYFLFKKSLLLSLLKHASFSYFCLHAYRNKKIPKTINNNLL